MGTSWRVARCIDTLRAEVNAAYPNRPTAADGTIGDAAHQAEVSDHNPNAAGVVTAWDITAAPFSDGLAETLRAMGGAGDGRVKYVIWTRRITSAVHGWQWAPYSGADPHTSHIHLSVSADPAQYDRTDPWLGSGTPPVPEEDVMATLDEVRQVVKEELAAAVKQLHAEHVIILHGDSGHPVSIDALGKALHVPGAPS